MTTEQRYDLKIHDLSDSESDMIYNFMMRKKELENKTCVLSKGTILEPIGIADFLR